MKTHLHQLFSGMVIAVRKLVFTSLRIIHELNCLSFVCPTWCACTPRGCFAQCQSRNSCSLPCVYHMHVWDWTNKKNNCTKRCYGLMKELFVYVSLIIDWIDGKFSRYFLPNRWQADIDKCFLNIIKCQWLSLTYSMALIVRQKSIL